MERGSLKSRALWQRAISVSRNAAAKERAGGEGGNCGNSPIGGASMLKSRNSFQALATTVVQQKNREKELKAKTEELEDVKCKLEHERSSKQKLQREIDDQQVSLQNARSKLQRSEQVAEKLRLENTKKSEQVEKLERNVSQLEDRIRNLEIRASEVEKAELTLESTRRNLENSQHECRAKESEIQRLQDKYVNMVLELDKAKARIEEMTRKMEDLKHQVRHELIKNENIERGLETIPHLKDDITDRDKRIVQLQKEVEEKTALLTASRKAVRDYKDRIRDLEREEANGEDIRMELELAQQEVASLKQLIVGKDSLIMRKYQVLDQTKLMIESLSRAQNEQEKLNKIQQILSKLTSAQSHDHLHSNGLQQQCDIGGGRGVVHHRPPNAATTYHRTSAQDSDRELSVDIAPFYHDADYNALDRCARENNVCTWDTAPTQFAIKDPVRCSASSTDHGKTTRCRQPSPRNPRRAPRGSPHTRPLTSHLCRPQESLIGCKFVSSRSLDYSPQGANVDGEGWAHLATSWQHSPWKMRPSSAVDGPPSSSEMELDSELASDNDSPDLQQLTARQKDNILAAAVTVGDRVSFSILQKPPRYGRKKPKPIVYTGIVKYLGRLDKESYDARVYCGVRLDEPIGENDGMYRSKRYMFTPQNHAKFFKICDMSSILDIKSGQYLPTDHLLLRFLKEKSKHPGNESV